MEEYIGLGVVTTAVVEGQDEVSLYAFKGSEGYLVKYGEHKAVFSSKEKAMEEWRHCVEHSLSCAGLSGQREDGEE